MEELNVKEVIFHDKEDELVEYSAKANFKVLGKELGAKMKTAAAQIEKLSSAEIESLFDGATLSIDVEGQAVELTSDKVILNRIEKANLKVLNEGTLTVALNTQVTEELLLEGYIRDLVRAVQNLRKESGLEVTDRITLSVSGTDTDGKRLLQKAFEANKDYLMNETLAVEAVFGAELPAGKAAAELDMGDGLCWHIALEKAGGV